MDLEKPFRCPKCSLAFATSDKLAVHHRLHVNENHLLVKIPATSSSDNSTEQTPTPTRFLKTADVDGSLLFEEINPFDQDFKLASKHRDPSGQSTSAVSSTVEANIRKELIQQRCGSSSSQVSCNGETEVTSSTSEEARLQRLLKPSCAVLAAQNQITSSTSEELSETLQALESNANIVYRTPSSVAVNSIDSAVASSCATTTQTLVTSTNQAKQSTETSLQSLLQTIRKQTQSTDETVKSTPTSSAAVSQEVLREQLKSLIKSGQIKIKFTSDPASPKVQATIVGNIAKKPATNTKLDVLPTLIPRGPQETTVQVASLQPITPATTPGTQAIALHTQGSTPNSVVLPPQVQVVPPNVALSHVIHIKPRQIIPKPIAIAPREIAPLLVTTTTAATTFATTSSQLSKSVTVTPMSVLSVPASSTKPWQVHTHPSSSLAFAKQKLKNVIQQNATTNGATVNSLANGRVSMVTTTGSSQGKYKDIFLDGDLKDLSSDLVGDGSPGGAGKRKGDLGDECSPEEKRQRFLDHSRSTSEERMLMEVGGEEGSPEGKRQKFLERNRAAASRCRQKRKIWVNQLESKSDDLVQTNNLLMNEINALRSEVAQLKALLLAHKECPVTLQQKALLGQMTPGSYVAAVSDGQIIAIHQVPNGNAQQTSSAEEVASSALTDMAARATIELQNHVTSGSVTVQSNDGSVSSIGSTLVPS